MKKSTQGSAPIKRTQWFTFAVQAAVVILAGILAKDLWYKIPVSILGLCFNFFTCYGRRSGFLAGVLYAVTTAAVSFHEDIYATAVFMLFIQAPVALYTYVGWGAKQGKAEPRLKKMNRKQTAFFTVLFPVAIIVLYVALKALRSNGPLLDAAFFTMTLMSCILLALYYRAAYIFVCLSGLSGSLLWLYQTLVNGTGISLTALYVCVFINAVMALKSQYGGRSPQETEKENCNV